MLWTNSMMIGQKRSGASNHVKMAGCDDDLELRDAFRQGAGDLFGGDRCDGFELTD